MANHSAEQHTRNDYIETSGWFGNAEDDLAMTDTDLQKMLIDLVRATGASLEALSTSTANNMATLQRDISEIREGNGRIEEKLVGMDLYGSQKSREVEKRVDTIENTLSYGKGAVWILLALIGGLWAVVLVLIAQHKW